MRMRRKTQSILEYLIVLSAIVVAIMVGTGTFHMGMRRSLSQMETEITHHLGHAVDDTYKEEVVDLDPSKYNVTMRPPESYEGRPFFEHKKYRGYYYHEGSSDMSRVPPGQTVIYEGPLE